MKITDQARDALNEIFKNNGVNGLRMDITETCCGKSPVIAMDILDDGDIKEQVNGVDVVIPDELEELADTLVIDQIDGELVVLNSVCGCHHDHEDGECCGGHGHHDHEDGSCCGGHGHGNGGCCHE